jgi:L-tartrate/succinate antiporter
MKISWKAFAPIAVAVLLALIPPPAGLQQFAWWYFAIFAGVIIGLMFEPLPGGAIGLIGVCLVTVLANHVYLSPEEAAKAGTHWPAEAIRWGMSGFANTTVWLIFGAFMFALGYEKTGLGRRIALLLVKALRRKTLTLGYAVMASDLILAPEHGHVDLGLFRTPTRRNGFIALFPGRPVFALLQARLDLLRG